MPRRRKEKIDTLLPRLQKLAPGAKNRSEALTLIVDNLLRDVARTPVDLEQTARKLAVVDICPSEDLVGAGALEHDKDGLVIRYRVPSPNARKRFTIAHELGHALLETTGNRPPRRGHVIERFCDEFAGALLMPDAELRAAIDEVSLTNLRKVVGMFAVSRQAAALRYAAMTGAGIVFEAESGQWTAGVRRSNVVEVLETIRRRERVDVVTVRGVGRIRRVEVEYEGDTTVVMFIPAVDRLPDHPPN